MYLDTTDKAPNTDVLSQDDVVSLDEVSTSYPSPQSIRKRVETVTIETGATTTRVHHLPRKDLPEFQNGRKNH